MIRQALLAPLLAALLCAGAAQARAAEDAWPALPARNAAVEIPAQDWPLRPGPRTVRVGVFYPAGTKASIGPRTGIFLSLHNWGGLDVDGTADPQTLAREFNCVALSVRYLQSGKADSIDGPEPYDFGYLQALDALRAVGLVLHQLEAEKVPFARGRIFATGGSGGGNVSLMANKLAPRTFACIVDMCGMKKLSDVLAYNLPGSGGLNARWSRDPASPSYLSPDAQEIRFVGHPRHLSEMKRLGASAKVVIVHGVDDKTCLADGYELAANLLRAGLDAAPVWVTPEMIDGKVFLSTGHSLGNRTLIPGHVAGKWLGDGGPESLARQGPNDFDLRQEIRYETAGGAYIISYASGVPSGRFEPAPPAPRYADRFDLLRVEHPAGVVKTAGAAAEWAPRRSHIRAALERVLGRLPNPAQRPALEVRVLEETKLAGDLVRRKLSFQSDATDRVAAYLFLPPGAQPRPAVLCLQQTTAAGKAEPAGLTGDPSLHYALALAQRGFVTLAPDYPGFGDSQYDFAPRHGYASGSMKAVWDNIRAVDLLESLPQVDPARIGALGHSLGGHNALFTAVFEPRLKAVVSSCGFTTFRKDDLPSWTGPRYLPRIQSEFASDAARVPFDFPEILAALAPRPVLAIAAEDDRDFDVSGVRETLAAAQAVYALHGAAERLQGLYPQAPHSFPPAAQQAAFGFLERELK